REGRLGHVEVFLQMCCFVTSIFERPRLFLCLQHARIRKLIYTQNSEEPIYSSTLTNILIFCCRTEWLSTLPKWKLKDLIRSCRSTSDRLFQNSLACEKWSSNRSLGNF